MDIQKEQQLIYLTRRQAEVAQLKNFSEDTFELAMMIGHKLKGHGETFGFLSISLIGVSMEQAAKDRDTDKLKETINDLDRSVEENIKIIAQL